MTELEHQVEAIKASERECRCGATIYWDTACGGYWAHLMPADCTAILTGTDLPRKTGGTGGLRIPIKTGKRCH